MSLFQRTYLGLDIRPDELRLVSMQRRGKQRHLVTGRLLGLDDGLLSVGTREPNIANLDLFVERLREILDPVSGKEERVSVGLPDGAGRQLVTEVETVFKSRQEGCEILRWQLKASLPAEPQDVHLDYQLLEQQESGRHRLLVAVIARAVVEQYEEAFDRAGYQAAWLDFHSANLYNWYRQVVDMGDEFVLVGCDGDALSFRYQADGRVVFQRSRVAGMSAEKIFQEVNRSLAGAREMHPEINRARVYLHNDWQEAGSLVAALETVFEKEVVSVSPRFDHFGAVDLGVPEWRARGLAGAAGAAERMM
ncbi:type IV pilus biogenesis protein PilM [Geothermobacter hydrogeniphilus]|uniref:Type IV pilus assembly protein PilM n=1 Tax=Geothermobacter hydrogeniphilus TaxID=1969733 RepID=A0A1X0YCS8_9BACT|nr:hypothetical protein [Geothermobacter hydrogeniphilus]ORJ62912.1 hypothetical protein B5V00_02315 [Geothermobacter hydrogeniphilus]